MKPRRALPRQVFITHIVMGDDAIQIPCEAFLASAPAYSGVLPDSVAGGSRFHTTAHTPSLSGPRVRLGPVYGREGFLSAAVLLLGGVMSLALLTAVLL